jgi:hypothetical protein
MACNPCTEGVTMRHDLLLGAWHRIAHRAGVATTVEPVMEQLRAGTGRASLERSDMLVVLPDEGLVVTDVSVVHPATNSFLQQAARTAGAASSLTAAAATAAASAAAETAAAETAVEPAMEHRHWQTILGGRRHASGAA